MIAVGEIEFQNNYHFISSIENKTGAIPIVNILLQAVFG